MGKMGLLIASALAYIAVGAGAYLDGSRRDEQNLVDNSRILYPFEQKAYDAYDDSELREMITRHEGLKLHSYNDSKGYKTVGIGFNLERKNARSKLEQMGLDYEKVFNGIQDITKEQAQQLMNEDFKTAISDAKQYLGEKTYEKIDDEAKKIIIDMAYAMGINKLSRFVNLKQALTIQNYQWAAYEIQDSEWYSDVKTRGVELVKKMRKIKTGKQTQTDNFRKYIEGKR